MVHSKVTNKGVLYPLLPLNNINLKYAEAVHEWSSHRKSHKESSNSKLEKLLTPVRKFMNKKSNQLVLNNQNIKEKTISKYSLSLTWLWNLTI